MEIAMEDAGIECGIDETEHETCEDNFNADIAKRIRENQHPITLDNLVVTYLQALHTKHPNNKSAAARTAGKSRWALARLLKKHSWALSE